MAMQNQWPLSDRATQVGKDLFWTMLPSTSLQVTVTGMSKDKVKRGVRELHEATFVDIHELGCLLPAVPVIRWTETGLTHFEANEVERSWRGADGLGSFVRYDFAKLEAVNAVAPFYATNGWALATIHLYEREPMFAAAEYRHPNERAPAYLVFCWASIMDTQRELCERLEALPEAMQVHSMDPTETFWPGGIALVAAGEWGAARALGMARAVLGEWVPPRSIAGWYHGSDGWHVSDASSALTGAPPQGMPPLLLPIKFLPPPPMSIRKLGNNTLANVLARSLYAGRRGQKLVQLLTLVAIYPCGSVAHYSPLMGEKRRGNETRKRLKVLEGMGLIEIVTKHGRATRRKRWPEDIPVTLSNRGQGEPRYAATLAGRVHFCYVHGGRPEDLFRRTKLGRLKTEVRDKVLLHLVKLSWMVHLCCAPGLRQADLSGLAALARGWKDLREGTLVYLLTLACILHLHHAPGRTALDALALTGMDRIWTQLRESMVEDRWLYQHEDIVHEVMGQLREAGCSFAPGWQARTTLADGRRIDPDGAVLVETPWGRCWCYLEVELSDKTYMAVKPRCDKYGSDKRMDDLPVLIICRDDQAERNFHLAAAGSDITPLMLTTTLTRLKGGGFFGPGVWSDYGEAVTLAP